MDNNTNNGIENITILVHGGLCNRLDAVMFGIALLKKYRLGGGKIRVLWEKTHDCSAYYDELFEPIALDGIRVERPEAFHLRHSRPRNLRLPSLLRRLTFDKCYDGGSLTASTVDAIIRHERRVFIESYRNPLDSFIEPTLYSIFKPIADIRQKIEQTTRTFAPGTIGVHIRRTDHADSIRESPLPAFFKLMDDEIRAMPSRMFYVASDDSNVRRDMVQRYGSRIISPRRELSRGTVGGMQDAVAELFCLASTDKIIGSSRSTYSIDAARMRDIPLLIVTDGTA